VEDGEESGEKGQVDKSQAGQVDKTQAGQVDNSQEGQVDNSQAGQVGLGASRMLGDEEKKQCEIEPGEWDSLFDDNFANTEIYEKG